MSQINVVNVTFGYEGSYDTIFDSVSFSIDSDWKLGLIGRNGRGKTTFLNLLLGKYQCQGIITSSVHFDYFPYQITEEDKSKLTIDLFEQVAPNYELWKVCRECEYLQCDTELFYHPYETLSYGEQTKVMLALLFSEEGHFLLIDEPTNHLDLEARKIVQRYLNRKKGFILVSHDRTLLDACVDHILSINRNTIEVQKGNFSSWWENKRRQDAFELAENEKHKKEIHKLEEAVRQSSRWADKVESTKIGYNPRKETTRSIDSRAYISEKSRRMQQRRKNLERRQQKAIEEKSELLKNIEEVKDLKLVFENHYKEMYLRFSDVTISYGETEVLQNLSFELKRGERVILQGRNGCGKSSIIKAILKNENAIVCNQSSKELLPETLSERGQLEVVKGLKISYINQTTSHLKGKLNNYIEEIGLEESRFKAVLRQLNFDRTQFDKPMEEYSEGQKKKVLIVGSLLQEAHLYIWDEPLNYIDVFSRMQIEALLEAYHPTMLLIEHDEQFCEKVGTKVILLENR